MLPDIGLRQLAKHKAFVVVGLLKLEKY